VRNRLGMAQRDDRACSTGPPPSNDAIARISPPSLPSPVILPGFLARPPINSIREDYPPWEIPFRMTIRGSHPSKFINIFILAYIIIILLVYSKSVTTEICEIKSEKNTRPHETPNAIDPAKRGLERTRIELAVLDFCPGAKRAPPAHRAD